MLYALHELAKNPDAQERLSDEVASVLGSSSVVTEEQLQHLHYLKGCIKESLRYYLTLVHCMHAHVQCTYHTCACMHLLTAIHLLLIVVPQNVSQW